VHSFVSLLSDSGVALEPAVKWPRRLAGRYRMGSRFVPPMEVPKRGPERSMTRWLSRGNVVETQGESRRRDAAQNSSRAGRLLITDELSV
jgi:hypothetical protein